MSKISVVTIHKDHPDGLLRTLTSLAKQQNCDLESDVELIVVDGSKKKLDETKEIITHFGALVSQVHYGEAKGIYPALNFGLEHVNSPYHINMNAGDTFANKKVMEKILTAMNDYPEVDFIYGDAEIGPDRKIWRSASFEEKGKRMIGCHQSLVYKTDLVGDLRYSDKYKICSDYDFTVKYLKNSQHPIYIPEPFSHFEGGGISNASKYTSAIEGFQVRQTAKEITLLDNLKETIPGMVITGLSGINSELYGFLRQAYHFVRPKARERVFEENPSCVKKLEASFD